MNQALLQAVKDQVPTIRLAMAHQNALLERLDAIENASGDASLALQSVDRQVAHLQATRLVHMAGCHLGSVITNLAHSEEAFALLAPELDAPTIEHARDTVADEVAFAPLQGISAEVTITASLSAIDFDLGLVNRQIDRAFTLLNAAFKN